MPTSRRGNNADVYVFAVQTACEHTNYDPLDTDSLSLASVRTATGKPALFADLGDRIRAADPRLTADPHTATWTT
ncbi:hypothetical protein ACFRKB_35390 [Streptomyces scopuliridis]|uniref:hypothetical protein n=1 Tax=Streptomyces scopuliridis TaxID=452529 RepID=UPI0036896F3C